MAHPEWRLARTSLRPPPGQGSPLAPAAGFKGECIKHTARRQSSNELRRPSTLLLVQKAREGRLLTRAAPRPACTCVMGQHSSLSRSSSRLAHGAAARGFGGAAGTAAGATDMAAPAGGAAAGSGWSHGCAAAPACPAGSVRCNGCSRCCWPSLGSSAVGAGGWGCGGAGTAAAGVPADAARPHSSAKLSAALPSPGPCAGRCTAACCATPGPPAALLCADTGDRSAAGAATAAAAAAAAASDVALPATRRSFCRCLRAALAATLAACRADCSSSAASSSAAAASAAASAASGSSPRGWGGPRLPAGEATPACGHQGRKA